MRNVGLHTVYVTGKRMKILFLSSLFEPYIGGGAEITLRTLVKGLHDSGVEVAVLTVGPQRGLMLEEVDGIRVWRAGIRNLYFHHGSSQQPGWRRRLWHALDIYNPLMKHYISSVIETEQPDVASCHILAGWSVSAWDVFKRCGIPIVQVLHDLYLLCPKSTMFKENAPCRYQCPSCRLMRLPHKAKSNQARAVVGVSHFILDKLLAHGYFRDTPIKEAIHNARNFPFNIRELPPRPDDGNMVFGFIGNLAPSKGIELLLDTFVQCAKPDWRLLVAGSGKADYEAMLKSRFVDPRISFLGRCNQRDFYQNVDVTVVPSLWEEPLGMVVAESMMFGAPVIGARRGGISEMVREGVNGLLFAPDHPDALKNAMNKVADDIGFWKRSREMIRDSARTYSDGKAWVARWLELYDRVAALDSKNGRTGAFSWN